MTDTLVYYHVFGEYVCCRCGDWWPCGDLEDPPTKFVDQHRECARELANA